MNAADKNGIQSTLVDTPPVGVPVAELSDGEIITGLAGLYDILREMRASQDALALEVMQVNARLDALPDQIAGKILEDLHSVASIYRAATAREAAQDAQEASPAADGATERARAIPGEAHAGLVAGLRAYGDAGIQDPGSAREILDRAKRAPEPAAFLINMLAALHGRAPSSIRASMGSQEAGKRAASPHMAAYLARAASKNQEGRSWVGGLAWLAAVPQGETFCRYSLLMHQARTAESLYAEVVR